MIAKLTLYDSKKIVALFMILLKRNLHVSSSI